MSMTMRKPETIAVHMARKGWKIGKLAREAELSPSVIHKAMKGEKIRPETARAIALALGVEMREIEGLNY